MKRTLALGLIALLFVLPIALLGPRPAAADTTFIVNNNLDVGDAVPGDGFCETVTGNGVCTLRAAVQEVNALAGNDTIILPVGDFNLTGTGDDNAATGDLDLTTNVNINGSSVGGTRIFGNNDRVFHILNGASVNLSNLSVRSGNLGGSDTGAGILQVNGTLTLMNAAVEGTVAGSANYGGGIYVAGGSLNVQSSTISANTAVIQGGGLYVGSGSVNINQSTLSGNSAGAGGAIYVPGGVSITVNNSTISGNTASGGGVTNGGGGVFASGTANLNSVTVAANSAPSASGGGILQLGGTINLRNTLVGTNSAPVGPDCSGTATSLGFNLIGITDGCTGIFNGVNGDKAGNSVTPLDPRIDPLLANNGGITKTHKLLDDSPAVESANPSGCGDGSTNFSNDQRGAGFPRHQDADVNGNARCDIGAFELGPLGATVTPSNTPTPTITFTPTITNSPVPTTSTPSPAPTTSALAPTITLTITPTFTPIGGKLPPATVNGSSGGGGGGLIATASFPTPATLGPTPSPDFTQTQIGLTLSALTATAFDQAPLGTTTGIPSVTPTFALPAEDVSLSTSSEVGVDGGSIACGIWLVSAPPASVPQGSIFRCETINPELEAQARLPFGARSFWHIVNVAATDPNGQPLTRFSPPLSVCAYYQAAYLEAVAGDAARLVVYTAENPTGNWVALPTTPDPTVPRVCADTSSLSVFRLVTSQNSLVGRLTSPIFLVIAGALCLLLTVVFIIIIVAIARRRRPPAPAAI